MLRKTWLKRASIRKACENIIFRLDTTRYLVGKPDLVYQPLPWIGIHDARRGTGSKERIKTITDQLDRQGIVSGSAMDVGCNVGYFALSLMEKGFFVYGIEGSDSNLSVAKAASRNVKGGWFAPVEITCDPGNTKFLPTVDVIIFLSVWHHWVRYYGLESATGMLAELWNKTKGVLFFDTGENEMPSHYNLPFQGGDARAWLEKYLAGICVGGRVSHLGKFAAFPPGGHENQGNVTRNLFMLKRE